MTRDELTGWVDRYEQAWRTAGTELLADLFSSDATYRMSPFEDEVRGLGAIADMWEAEREGPEEVFTMQAEVVTVEGDTGVVRAEVAYGAPTSMLYRDLWVVRLDEQGRCFHFEEWPFWPGRPRSAG